MSKQRTKQKTKQQPPRDHQHSALFDEMTADEADYLHLPKLCKNHIVLYFLNFQAAVLFQTI